MTSSQSINIRIELLKRGLKQIDIAKKANVAVSVVNEVISGKKKSQRVLNIINQLIRSEHE